MAKEIDLSMFEATTSSLSASLMQDTLQGTMQGTASECNEVQGYSIEQVMTICSIARRTAFKYASEVLQTWYWLPEYDFRVNGVYSEFALAELKRRKSLGTPENYRMVVHQENVEQIANWKASQKVEHEETETPTDEVLKATSDLIKITADSTPFSGLAIQTKATERVESLAIELKQTDAETEADFAAFMELTAEIITQDDAAELADDLEFQKLRKQNATKWLKRKAILESDKQKILQGNIANPKKAGNSPAAVS